MATNVHDDYLICREYQEQIDKKSSEYPGFITFKHDNGNHYFAWVDGDKIIMRSEAYPDADKMERGIKAVIKNRDIYERYSTEESHGAHFLILWGGGEHQEHTGNMESHNEIGRSCPQKSADDLKALLAGYNSDLANQIKFSGLAALAATTVTHPAATAMAETSSTSNTDSDTGGMGWLKWLIPLVLIGGLAWWMMSTKGCSKPEAVAPIVDTVAVNTTMDLPKITVDSVTGYVTYDLGATGDVDLPNGTKILGAAANGFERTLLNFITTGSIDTVDKTKNWFTLHDVQFKTGTDEYATEKAMVQLTNVASVLKAFPNVVLKLGGYTDVRGDDTSNMKLSQKRADIEMKDLIKLGAKPSQIKEAVGYGEEFATATEGDVEGMARDRKTAAKVASM
ncbi:MAG TPA: OmpA family protein [Saprospiraceae bacterium]|nr:OmpA family protein [Saprospiraceae bacterium]